MLCRSVAITFLLIGFVGIEAQQPAAVQQAQGAAAPIERRLPADPDLDIASNLIGQALFLRCFCADDSLAFSTMGQPELRGGRLKTVDWTLSAINVQKVERRSPGEIELQGVRVAVRFAPDRREWDRHPQKTETMRLTLTDTGDAVAFRRELAAVFSVGIDRALQRSTPPYWQHYFDPQMPWPADDLGTQTLYTPGKPDASGLAATVPSPSHKVETNYTAAAQRDAVKGSVGLQFAVSADGSVRRLAIAQPLGYGLDAEAAEALSRYRFSPGTLNGTPVATQVRMNQDFVLVAAPR